MRHSNLTVIDQVEAALAAADPVLEALITARDEATRDAEIARLVSDIAAPVIESVLSRQLRTEWVFRAEAMEDLRAAVNLRVVRKLRALSRDPEEIVGRFRDYVATLTYNAVSDSLRERYPEWSRLKGRIRYVLEHDPRLGLWSNGGRQLCGLASWSGRTDSAEPVGAADPTPAMLDRHHLGEAVAETIRREGKPIELDSLVRLFATIWKVAELTVGVSDELMIVAGAATPLAQVEARGYIEALWREISALRPLQRAALLLNLRDTDGGNALAYFVLLSVADIDELADSIGVTAERLAAMWNELPLDDLTIARMLGIRRQQVINLRRSARDRLLRRLSGEAK